MRIDAHQHYWRYNAARDTWIDDTMALLRHDYLPDNIAPFLETAGFWGAIAVQADQTESETEFLIELASRHDRVRGVVGWVDIRSAKLEEHLAMWNDVRVLKGFRHIAQSEPDDFLARPEVIDGVRILGAHDYTFDILIRPPQFDAAIALVENCPGVRFVLDHCGKPSIHSGELDEWRKGILRLAAYPNVACKVSGLVTEARWADWDDRDLIPYLDVVLESFGSRRLMFGSDWPVCLLAADWSRVYDVVAQWSSQLGQADREALFGRNAVAIYKLDE